MATCNGCGGIVGRDCYNPQECEWISRDQQARAMAREYAQPESERIGALEAEVAEMRAIIATQFAAQQTRDDVVEAAAKACDECAGTGKCGPDDNPNELDCEVCEGSGNFQQLNTLTLNRYVWTNSGMQHVKTSAPQCGEYFSANDVRELFEAVAPMHVTDVRRPAQTPSAASPNPAGTRTDL
jgi:hypothetical protein